MELQDEEDDLPSTQARLAALEFFVASLLSEQIRKYPGQTQLEMSIDDDDMALVGKLTDQLMKSVLKKHPGLPSYEASTYAADAFEGVAHAFRSLATRARDLAREDDSNSDPNDPDAEPHTK